MEMEKKEGFSHFKAYFEVLDYISDHAAFDPFLFPDNVKNPFLGIFLKKLISSFLTPF